MSVDNESTANSVVEHDNKSQSDFLNMFANYSIFMDMVKRTAIDTAEAIVKRELRNFFSGFLEGLDCDDCNEEISEQRGGGFKATKTRHKSNNKIIK